LSCPPLRQGVAADKKGEIGSKAAWYIQHIRRSFRKDYSLAPHLNTTAPFHNKAHPYYTWQRFGYMHALHFRPLTVAFAAKNCLGGCPMYHAFRVLETATTFVCLSGCFESFYPKKLATQEVRLLFLIWVGKRKTKNRSASIFFFIFRTLWPAALEKARPPHTGTRRNGAIDGRHNYLNGRL
jgi:hypothetical protein